MKPKVYIARRVSKEVQEYISKFCDLEMNESDEILSREKIVEKYNHIDGLITIGTKIDEEFLNSMPNLKVVSNISVGYDNFVIKDMKKRKIIGTNTPDTLNDTVADLALGLILSVARRIPELDKITKAGMWTKVYPEEYVGTEVHHKTLGIIGMGRIGEVVAKRAKLGFDMDVLYYNRHRKEETEKRLGVKYYSKDELIKKSDFIVVLTPLTKETYHFIDEREFNLMKKSAIIINVSRGQTINELALIDAIKTGKIAGAGVDVFEKEPTDKNNPLLRMENVVTLPHIGSGTWNTRNHMSMVAAEDMVSALQGNIPKNLVEEFK
ncbi:2-hydroxyacid dehydrogenase [Haloimpatiens lingqiaonensis]|uniref:2-hydroxyacid dehydrogenase n=1 Tax=Haloimpatiens lingqiaonensis TaxID=1380675 RepID=UPI0010FD4115|nr:D-glycerate dehydrogenase [Haloimpatiens lingqiaonensis]